MKNSSRLGLYGLQLIGHPFRKLFGYSSSIPGASVDASDTHGVEESSSHCSVL